MSKPTTQKLLRLTVQGLFMARLLNAAWTIFDPSGICKREGLKVILLRFIGLNQLNQRLFTGADIGVSL